MTSHSERYCAECKQVPVEGKAIFCSPKCRKRHQRRLVEVHTVHWMVMAELSKIRDSIKRKECIPDAIGDLKALKAEINDLLLLAGDVDAKERAAMLTQRKIQW